MASKYDALGEYLRSQYGTEIPMTFAAIEAVIGFRLPRSARTYRPWWSNNADNSAMTKVWLNAGFRTAQVDLAAEKLVFVREHEGKSSMNREFAEAPAHGSTAAAKGPKRHPAIGAMKGMITVMPGVDLTEPVDPEWVERLYDAKAPSGDLVGGLDDPVPSRR
jgi:hypothetical protein